MRMNDLAREQVAIRRQMLELHAKGYERISCAFGVGKLWELDRGARYQWKIVDAVIGKDGKSVFVKAEPPTTTTPLGG
jgi:hypothetical protein